MNLDIVLFILLSLAVKHFLADYPLQRPYQYKNKGTYLHPGGLLHAGLHGVGTWIALAWFVTLKVAVTMAIIDFIVHYRFDWAKMKLNTKLGYDPLTHDKFWWLFGLRQLLHTLTYITFIWYLL